VSNPFAMTLLAAASPILGGVYSRLKQGKAQAQAAADQAQASKVEAQMDQLRATQTAELSRSQLFQTLGNIDSIRSARGVNLDSATGQAIERQTTQNAYRNEAVSVLGALNDKQSALWNMSGYSRTAKNAIPLAAIEAGSNAGMQIMSMMAKGG
jgi:hypothetical protein